MSRKRESGLELSGDLGWGTTGEAHVLYSLPIHFLDIFQTSGACSDLDIFRECLDLLAIFGLLAISFSWIRKNLKTLELGREMNSEAVASQTRLIENPIYPNT